MLLTYEDGVQVREGDPLYLRDARSQRSKGACVKMVLRSLERKRRKEKSEDIVHKAPDQKTSLTVEPSELGWTLPALLVGEPDFTVSRNESSHAFSLYDGSRYPRANFSHGLQQALFWHYSCIGSRTISGYQECISYYGSVFMSLSCPPQPMHLVCCLHSLSFFKASKSSLGKHTRIGIAPPSGDWTTKEPGIGAVVERR